MSAKAKAKAKLKRRKEKSTKKAQKKALYESYREKGINSKSFRQSKKSKTVKGIQLRVSHGPNRCGNIGCTKCNGINFTPFLNSKGQSEHMPNWMWRKWKAVA